MGQIANPDGVQSVAGGNEGHSTIAQLIAAIPTGGIPLVKVAGVINDDDITGVTSAIVGSNLRFTVSEGTTQEITDLPLQTLANALAPLFAAAWAGMTSAQKRALWKELFSEQGSGWIDANDRYGEHDGKSGTAGFTDIAAL